MKDTEGISCSISFIFISFLHTSSCHYYTNPITGPDVELIEEILAQVGKRHKDFGVESKFFPSMGTALVEALEDMMGPDHFNELHKTAWNDVYREMSSEIVKAM